MSKKKQFSTQKQTLKKESLENYCMFTRINKRLAP